MVGNGTGVFFRLRNVIKRYADREVVSVGELDLVREEVFALIGPSGAGKSTLLRMLGLLESPDAGELTFVSHDGDSWQPNGREVPIAWRRRTCMVFQHPLLLDRTVVANVGYGLKLRGKRNWRALALDILEHLQLGEFAHARARTLSAGEAQRVALARALVIQPEVLLLDEPTANLDPYNVGLVEETISSIRGDASVVLVTHNVHQARRMSDHVALMWQGRIIEHASVAEFFDAPKLDRTAAFLRGELVY